MEIKEILQVLVDFMKVSSHKNYLKIVNSQKLGDLIPVKNLGF